MEDIFYCLCCKTMFTRERARAIFKTGFYKTVPLGICGKCDQHLPDEIRESYNRLSS